MWRQAQMFFGNQKMFVNFCHVLMRVCGFKDNVGLICTIIRVPVNCIRPRTPSDDFKHSASATLFQVSYAKRRFLYKRIILACD